MCTSNDEFKFINFNVQKPKVSHTHQLDVSKCEKIISEIGRLEKFEKKKGK